MSHGRGMGRGGAKRRYALEKLFEDSEALHVTKQKEEIEAFNEEHEYTDEELHEVVLWVYRIREDGNEKDYCGTFKWSEIEDMDARIFTHPAFISALTSVRERQLELDRDEFGDRMDGEEVAYLGDIILAKLKSLDPPFTSQKLEECLKLTELKQPPSGEGPFRRIFDEYFLVSEADPGYFDDERSGAEDEESEEEEEATLDGGRIVQVGGATVLDPPVSLTVVNSKKVGEESMLTVTYSPPGSSSKPVTTEVPAEQIAKRVKIDEKIVATHAAAAAGTITPDAKISELIRLHFSKRVKEGSVKTTDKVKELCVDICIILSSAKAPMLAKGITNALVRSGKWSETTLKGLHKDQKSAVSTVNSIIGIQLEELVVPADPASKPPHSYKLKGQEYE